jgi:hypothetical protein
MKKEFNLMLLLITCLIIGMGLAIYGTIHSSLLVAGLGVAGLVVSLVSFIEILKGNRNLD